MDANGTADLREMGEVRLSSKDLERLLNSGNLNLEGLDLLQMSPSLVQQIQQIQQTTTADPNLNTATRQRTRPAASRQGSRVQNPSDPYVEIVEQPKARGLRFRYECEGRSAGSIPGETSTTEKKTFPTIKIHNYTGPAVVVVSCVTKDEPYKPHPHNLVGKDCKKGVCTLRIRDTTVVSFPHLGIQCAKKKDVDGNLKMRQEINVDPYQTGFKHKGQNIDLNVVRLCFQVFLPDAMGKITRIVPPVVSQAIYDKKALNDLVICRVDRTSGKPKGGDEVFLLCEKINRDDIRVRFFEEQDGQLIWEAFGDFGQNDVHRQFAIVFKTPPYRDQYLTQATDVFMQLQRSSDMEGSEAIQFTYQPEDPDPDRILEKRKRKAASLSYLQDSGSGSISQEQLKHRLKLKATRTTSRVKNEPVVKEEVVTPDLPQYSLGSFSGQVSGTMATTTSMAGQYNQGNLMEVSASTIASQTGLSGGKVQYTPVTSQPPQTNQVPSIALNQQVLQLLASGLLSSHQQSTAAQTAPPPQVVQQPAPAPVATQGQDQGQQVELLKQLLMALQGGQAPNQGGDNLQMTNQDPNLQSQNQEMNSLNSLLDQNLLQSLLAGESPMVSIESLEGLTGSLANIDYDPNVAGFETVGGESNLQVGQQPQQYDEASTAVQHLN